MYASFVGPTPALHFLSEREIDYKYRANKSILRVMGSANFPDFVRNFLLKYAVIIYERFSIR